MQTHLRSGCAILVLLLMSTTPAPARPMHVLSSTPEAEAIMQGRNAQYVVRFDGPVYHVQSRLEILHDGHVVQRLDPLLDSAPTSCSHRLQHSSRAATCFIGSSNRSLTREPPRG